MRSIVRTMALFAAIAGAVLAMQVSALAAPPDVVGPDNGSFLCPAVGQGVTNADAHNGDNGVSAIGPIGPGDQSFLPGKNQAGQSRTRLPTTHKNQGPHRVQGMGTQIGHQSGQRPRSNETPAIADQGGAAGRRSTLINTADMY